MFCIFRKNSLVSFRMHHVHQGFRGLSPPPSFSPVVLNILSFLMYSHAFMFIESAKYAYKLIKYCILIIFLYALDYNARNFNTDNFIMLNLFFTN